MCYIQSAYDDIEELVYWILASYAHHLSEKFENSRDLKFSF